MRYLNINNNKIYRVKKVDGFGNLLIKNKWVDGDYYDEIIPIPVFKKIKIKIGKIIKLKPLSE